MLLINKLEHRYGKKSVLKDMMAQWESSSIHGVVGQNGAGKTTFFNILSGIEKPTGGNILWNGQTLKYEDVGYLETHNHFYKGITGEDYLKLFPQSNTNFDIDIFQSFFKLPLNELIEYYSTGMKKKLALLAILKQNKDIFLLDEPFNGLDLESNKIMEVILDLLKAKRKTVIISSHVLGPLIKICDYIHYLSEGIIKSTFTADNFGEIEKLLFKDLKDQAQNELKDAI